MTNIRKGLHRIAILLITCMSFALLITQTVADWKTYRQNLEQLNLIKYTSVPGKAVLTGDDVLGRRFEEFYQKAVDARYTDKEIVEYLSDKYSDFDLKKFKENAHTIKEKIFRKTVIASLFYYSIISACLYLTILFSGFCIRWVAKGFNPNQCKEKK